MKKIIVLAILAVLSSSVAMAQEDKSFKLEKNRVIYLTTDTVFVDEGDTLYWNVSSLENPFNFAGMPINGSDVTDWNYKVAFRNDYTDPETGFTLNKGYYRGITLMETTLGLYGSFMNAEGKEIDYSAGYKNLKKVILYFVPLPNAKCTSFWYNYNHDRLPSNGGRVEAQYMNPDGTPKSNNAYRDLTVGTTLVSGGTPCEVDAEHPEGLSFDEYYYTLSNCPLNYTALEDKAFITGYNAALVTIDQPYKVSVDVTMNNNALRGRDFDELKDESKPTDFVSQPIDGLTESEMTYYFAKVDDTWPFDREPTDEEKGTYTSASGWNFIGNKWGNRVSWSADTPIKIGIKRRLYLVGIGLVCATEGAQTEYFNAGDWTKGLEGYQFTTEPTAAFGNLVEGNLPENPWADYVWGEGAKDPSKDPNLNPKPDDPKPDDPKPDDPKPDDPKPDDPQPEDPVIDGVHTIDGASEAGEVFNLQGQRVKAGNKGIVVKNGKKVVNQ